jgi:hypothetical protein
MKEHHNEDITYTLGNNIEDRKLVMCLQQIS